MCSSTSDIESAHVQAVGEVTPVPIPVSRKTHNDDVEVCISAAIFVHAAQPGFNESSVPAFSRTRATDSAIARFDSRRGNFFLFPSLPFQV